VLLATPLNVLILQALADGPKQQSELRRRAGSPAQTTLRAQLKRLIAIGAIEKHRRNRFPGVLEYELTACGQELLFVCETLEDWLGNAPDGSLTLGTGAAKAAIKALAEAWSSTMLRALAARPFSLTELDDMIGSLSYPSLERRLAALRLAGQVEARRGNGTGTPYGVTAWLRQGVAPLAAAARWERRHLPQDTSPISRLDTEAFFLLAVPLLQPPQELSGSCRMAAELPDGGQGHLAGVIVELESDGGEIGCTTQLKSHADAWAVGSSAAWLNAVIEHDVDSLELGGDCQLARALIEGLHEALFRVPVRPR
jgi:DNA-binding HxlR family transcriptional regulator